MGILSYYCWFWRTENMKVPFANWHFDPLLVDLETNEGWV